MEIDLLTRVLCALTGIYPLIIEHILLFSILHPLQNHNKFNFSLLLLFAYHSLSLACFDIVFDFGRFLFLFPKKPKVEEGEWEKER
ncbi:hypothetical protein L1987_45330 [Smallanthus sonchifolius]|uniref:Uncharacterized protein n=1 Tax=Smallanthus sonchifolius TaxID=185202 RepID=A0ACB9GT20_9ASTR|nr:hypothetical protein L1987_45330 [Smallanthus sonchifolius]